MSDYRVRVEADADQGAVYAVNAAAFPTPDEAELVDALREDAAWIAPLSFVATDGDAVVGHVLLTRLPIVGEDGEHRGDALALAPVAVAPEHQGRGVGARLVRAALDAAATAGEHLVVVLGEPAYYGRFGFGPAADLGVESPFDVPSEVFQALALPAYDSAVRGRPLYPEPFGVV
ncbi:GNAT family N-acetyltransferase [Yinghuangia seranimata]|uniref:GNAT family N-acetyltransferase n=1 Tax=Yinghuangia seranimata TaxID=408067 RepID=UPI00248B34D7|nr:N-acetyltransferase [Yinghuangia seranimata]MDI2132117.1 N-acetyltransferase [Yinghuangia seranimata]